MKLEKSSDIRSRLRTFWLLLSTLENGRAAVDNINDSNDVHHFGGSHSSTADRNGAVHVCKYAISRLSAGRSY